MNLRALLFALTGMLALSYTAEHLHANQDHSTHSKVKYVQGGACGQGKGTKKHPYTSLAQAQADESWDTLIVLPSTTALDGGITLRPGTKLIGAENPTEIALSTTQPTITNSSDATNDGNGIVVTGDAFIKNIYLKDTWAAGIRYDDGINLHVKQVLITGHNQGDVLSASNNSDLPPYEVAGIHGQIQNTGKTLLEKVIIRNNHTGSGVIEQPYQGAHRTMIVKSCELSELTSDNVNSEINIFTTTGLVAFATDEGTAHKVLIKNTYLHDFANNASSSNGHFGIGCFATDGAKTVASVVDSSLYRIATPEQTFAFQLFAESFVNSSVTNGLPAKLKLVVDHCTFEELPGNFASAVQVETDNSQTEFVVKNSRMVNVLDSIVSFIGGNSVQKERITCNWATGAEAFYIAATENFRGSVAFSTRTTDVVIKDNFYTGGADLGAIVVIPSVDGSNTVWDRLTIKAKNNCFDGQDNGFAGLLGFDFGSVGAGNANIYAHNNSIVGYGFDIFDFFANVNYFAQKNWWGKGLSCTIGADCESTQTCKHGFCVGPDNVLNLGTGIVDVSNPLTHSIKCPNNCCEGIGNTSTLLQNVSAASTNQELEDRLNEVKENFQARYIDHHFTN